MTLKYKKTIFRDMPVMNTSSESSIGLEPVRYSMVQRAHRSVFSVSNFHATKFGSPKTLQAENEKILSSPFVIHPYSVIRMMFDLTTAIVLFINIYTIPILISFPKFESIYHMVRPDSPYPQFAFLITISSDIWFMIDIMANFRTGYEANEKPILNLKKIRHNYMTGWFWLDIIATLPVDQIVQVFTGENLYTGNGDGTSNNQMAAADVVRYLKFIRLTKITGILRLIRLSRIFRNLTVYAEKIFNADVARGIFRIIFFIFVLITWMHLSACLQFLVPTFHPAYPHRNSWTTVQKLNADSKPLEKQYISSFFRAMSHMFCGYGNLAPQNISDLWATIVSALIGNLSKAAFIGVASSTMQMMAASKRLYKDKIESVHGYLNFRKVPHNIRNRVNQYYEERYAGKMFDEVKVLALVNPRLRKTIITHNCKDLVNGVPFLREGSKTFIEDILQFMKLEMYLRDDMIVKAGTFGRSMYFITKGTVMVEMIATNSEPFHLKEGDFFGEISLLMPTVRRQATITAIDTLYVYRLAYDDFNSIAQVYPREQTRLLEVARERLGDKFDEFLEAAEREVDFAQVHPMESRTSQFSEADQYNEDMIGPQLTVVVEETEDYS